MIQRFALLVATVAVMVMLLFAGQLTSHLMIAEGRGTVPLERLAHLAIRKFGRLAGRAAGAASSAERPFGEGEMGLDTVDLLLGFEEAFGIAIPDEEATRLGTSRQVADYVTSRVPVVAADGCLTQRTFYALRRGIRAAGAGSAPLRPATRLRTLSDRAAWPFLWTRVREQAADPRWPATVPWSGFWSDGPATLGRLARHVALRSRTADEPWTREHVELAIRDVVRDVAGIDELSLDDHFVADLKLD